MPIHLPVAACREGALLVNCGNDPVWPIASPADELWLAAAAENAGAVIVQQQARAYTGRSYRAGAVVALEDECMDNARLYAHLTRRRFLRLAHESKLAIVPDLEVVVCSADRLTARLLEALYGDERSIAPGIIYGDSNVNLRQQVLLRSAMTYWVPEYPGEHVKLTTRTVDEAAGDTAWARHAISRGASILSILTHSDGLDAKITQGVVACPLREPPLVEASRSPRCSRSGWCYRLERAVRDAESTNRLWGASDFRARLLIWSTGYGILDPAAPLDRRWSIVHQLASNPRVGALLARWRGSFGHGPIGEMVARIAEGWTLGAAIAEYNRAGGVRATAALWALIGDPNLIAPASRSIDMPESGNDSRVRLDTSRPTNLRETGSDRVQHTEGEHPPDEAPDGAFVAELHLLEHMAPRVTTEKERRPQLELKKECVTFRASGRLTSDVIRLQSVAIANLCTRTRIYEWWMPSVTHQLFNGKAGECAHCKESMGAVVHEFFIAATPRVLLHCPRCQLCRDAPISSDLDFRLESDRTVELMGKIPEGAFMGAGAVWSGSINRAQRFAWPTDAETRPKQRYRPTVHWPSEVTSVALWFMFDLNYIMLHHNMAGLGISLDLS